MSKADKAQTKKGAKSKKKVKYVEPANKRQQTDSDLPKKRKRKQVEVNSEEELTNEAKLSTAGMENENYKDTKDEDGVHDDNALHDENIDWPQGDLTELVERIENALPEKDNLTFNTRVEKLNWDDIAFKTYSGEDCKKMWLFVQKRIRRFRLLGELLQDAKEWISKPWTNFYKKKIKLHPDMPKKPLSGYMMFYIKKKDKIFKENPGIELAEASKRIAQLYKEITPAKKEKYTKLAAVDRKNYEEKLTEFYKLHPDIPRNLEKPSNKKQSIESGPKKPLTPFGLYCEDQLKKMDSSSKLGNHIFKEQCKEQWKNLSDKKKVVWINWALDQELKYHEDLKSYLDVNPDYEPGVSKTVINKEERLLKERVAGKPAKPPTSAYALFSSKMLQGDEIKKIDSKDRMKAVAVQWKNCTEGEKDLYRERAIVLMEQYKLDFASYLESLPEDKRQEELQNNIPKRKMKGEAVKATKRKKEEKLPTPPPAREPTPPPPPRTPSPILPPTPPPKEEPSSKGIFEHEPTQPPVSGYNLFCNKYKGAKPTMAWKTLSRSEKEKYNKRVQKLKNKYIKEYTKFLQTLTKKELKAFSDIKQARENKFVKKKKEVLSTSESSNSSEEEDSDV